MVKGKGGVVRVGMGSSLYGFVGRWVPKGLVGWMMGVRKVRKDDGRDFGRGSGMELVGGSRATSPGSSGGSVNVRYTAADLGMDESEYISVYGDKGLEIEHECDDMCNH
jgi:hypothetical protein